MGAGNHWAKIKATAGSCEKGNEFSGSIEDKEFLDYVSDHQLLEDAVPWS